MELIVRRFGGKPGKEEFHDEFHQFDELTNTFTPALPQELLVLKKSIEEIIFLTGNRNKLAELGSSLHLKDKRLSCPQDKIDLAEIQDSNVLNIVQDKCLRAREHMRKRHSGPAPAHTRVILVEDTSLNFEALHGMPGPYVKWFLDAIGPEGLFRMLAGFPCKAAKAVCIYALMVLDDQDQAPASDDSSREQMTVIFFRAEARGQIVEPRRGDPSMGWGWDPIFEEERSRLSFAEMSPEVKSKFSHRAGALRVLRTFFEV